MEEFPTGCTVWVLFTKVLPEQETAHVVHTKNKKKKKEPCGNLVEITGKSEPKKKKKKASPPSIRTETAGPNRISYWAGFGIACNTRGRKKSVTLMIIIIIII